MPTVDGITELRFCYSVDCNQVICQAYQTNDNRTKISLVTPQDAWTKRLTITTTGVFGYELNCGDKYGSHMSGLNSHNKQNTVDLGVNSAPIAIKFEKAKTMGAISNYGTLQLPGTVNGYHIIFFWPNDSEGDHWEHMKNILSEAQHVSGQVAGITGNVVQIGGDAAKLAAMFA
jgi:hypothetical protein